MLGSVLFYTGLVACLAGLISVVVPLRIFGLRTRRGGALITAAGVAVIAVAVLLPDPTQTAQAQTLLIDRWMPAWQFSERHELRIPATPQQVFASIRRVRASDIFLFRLLTFIRNPYRRIQGENILNAPADKPIIDVALAGGFVLLGEDPERELLLGAIVAAPRGAVDTARARGTRLDPPLFRSLEQPGFARAVMNFHATPEPDGWTLVTTETRVQTVDPGTERRFAAYWRAIFPGSWIIRWSWLRAIDRCLTACR